MKVTKPLIESINIDLRGQGYQLSVDAKMQYTHSYICVLNEVGDILFRTENITQALLEIGARQEKSK